MRAGAAQKCSYKSQLAAVGDPAHWPTIAAIESIHTPAARINFQRDSEVWISMNRAMTRVLGMSTQLMSIVGDAGLGPL